MNVLMMVLAGVFVIVFVFVIPVSMLIRAGGEPSTAAKVQLLAAAFFFFLGATGFLGPMFVQFSGMALEHVEFPVGSEDGIVRDSQGNIIVPSAIWGRIQIYDPEFKFIRGWPVWAGGGGFCVTVENDVLKVRAIKIQTAYSFSKIGELMEKRVDSGIDYTNSDPRRCGPDAHSWPVPTPFYLLYLTHPFIGWGMLLLGAILGGLFKKRPGKK